MEKLEILLNLLFSIVVLLFKNHSALAMENIALRKQLSIYHHSKKRTKIRLRDRLFWILVSRYWKKWKDAFIIVKSETVIGWYRKGFKLFWTWKSRRRGSGRPPSQAWRIFLKNHRHNTFAIDFFTVPTATFRVLYVFIVLLHENRKIVHFNVTANPTAAWTAQQIVEACPWDSAPKYLLRDRDGIYGKVFQNRVQGMGIEEVAKELEIALKKINRTTGNLFFIFPPTFFCSQKDIYCINYAPFFFLFFPNFF